MVKTRDVLCFYLRFERITRLNLEFHYYILFIICREAGFDENQSRIISYSSQLVDNTLAGVRIDTEKGLYKSIPTQNYGFWDDYFPANVYLPFHFFPGDMDYEKAKRVDGRKNPFNTTPGSSNAKKLLVSALKTRNLYRVGIALHTFADTWAHQNFTAFDDPWNRLDEGSMIPSIGHAQALTNPDRINRRWRDPRLMEPFAEVDNFERYLLAARQIYKYLATYNKKPFDDYEVVVEKIKWLCEDAIKSSSEVKPRLYHYIIEEDIPEYNKYEWQHEAIFNHEVEPDDQDGLVGYDKISWFKDAFLYRTTLWPKPVFRARENFYESHYYYWNEAAKEHLETAKSIVSHLLK